MARECWLLVLGGAIRLSPSCAPHRPVHPPAPPTVECSLARSETYSGNGCDPDRTWRVLPGGKVQSQQTVPGLEEGHVHCGDVEVFYRWRRETVWCQDDCPRPRSWEESVRRVVTRHDHQTEEWREQAFVCVGGSIYLQHLVDWHTSEDEPPLVPLDHRDGKLEKGRPDYAPLPADPATMARIGGVNWYVGHRGLYIVEEQLPLRLRLVEGRHHGDLETGILSSDGTRLCMSQSCGIGCIPIAGGHWEPTHLSVSLCAQQHPPR